MAGGPAIGGGGGRRGGGAAQTVGVLNMLTDLAFNLLIFFVVCASAEPDKPPEKGRPQEMPNSDKSTSPAQQSQNAKVVIKSELVTVNEQDVPVAELRSKLQELLAGKTKPEDRVVVFSSHPTTPYSQWIKITGLIEQAGGIVVVQLED